MTLQELMKYDMRKSIVLLRADKRTKLYLDGEGTSVTPSTHKLTILKVGPLVTDIKPGDEVIPANAALVKMDLSDLEADSYVFYTEDSFIKMFIPTE